MLCVILSPVGIKWDVDSLIHLSLMKTLPLFEMSLVTARTHILILNQDRRDVPLVITLEGMSWLLSNSILGS